MLLVHFLVLSLKTVDGQRNSALPYLHLMSIQHLVEEKAAAERSGKVRNIAATHVEKDELRMLETMMKERPVKLEALQDLSM